MANAFSVVLTFVLYSIVHNVLLDVEQKNDLVDCELLSKGGEEEGRANVRVVKNWTG